MTSDWTDLIEADQLPPGSLTRVQVEQGVFAVCNYNNKFYVVDNRCPHAEGSLGRGSLEAGCIICPVHRWPWDLATGLTDAHFPSMRLTFFTCEVRDGKICADLSHPIPPEVVIWPVPSA